MFGFRAVGQQSLISEKEACGTNRGHQKKASGLPAVSWSRTPHAIPGLTLTPVAGIEATEATGARTRHFRCLGNRDG